MPSAYMGAVGLLIGGIALLIVGIILAVSGSAAQSYSSSSVAACQSGLGQLGQFFSQDAKNRCAEHAAASTFGGIGQFAGYGLAIIGIIMVAIGGAQQARTKKAASW